MNNFDWKSVVRTVAPALGTALGTPVMGGAIKVITDTLLGPDSEATEEIVAQAIQSATPEQLAKLKEIDNTYKLQMEQLGVDLKKLEAESRKTEIVSQVEDTKDAREKFASHAGVFNLGIVILATFALVVGAVISGNFYLLFNPSTIHADPGLIAAVFGLIGTVVGYAASNAQQVVNWCFGSSFGSDKKTQAMADAVKQIKI